MNKNQLEQYVRSVADALGLRDWEFEVILLDLEDDAYAEIGTTPGRRAAEIRFFRSFQQAEPESQRNTVVHELLHAHLNQILDLVRDMEEAMGKMMFCPLYHALVGRLEDGVDAIATAVAVYFPLPEFSDE